MHKIIVRVRNLRSLRGDTGAVTAGTSLRVGLTAAVVAGTATTLGNQVNTVLQEVLTVLS